VILAITNANVIKVMMESTVLLKTVPKIVEVKESVLNLIIMWLFVNAIKVSQERHVNKKNVEIIAIIKEDVKMDIANVIQDFKD
jgi:hypothetical protein